VAGHRRSVDTHKGKSEGRAQEKENQRKNSSRKTKKDAGTDQKRQAPEAPDGRIGREVGESSVSENNEKGKKKREKEDKFTKKKQRNDRKISTGNCNSFLRSRGGRGGVLLGGVGRGGLSSHPKMETELGGVRAPGSACARERRRASRLKRQKRSVGE